MSPFLPNLSQRWPLKITVKDLNNEYNPVVEGTRNTEKEEINLSLIPQIRRNLFYFIVVTDTLA